MTTPISLPKISRPASRDWDVILTAFSNAPKWSYKQHWLPAQEETFRPATVSLAHDGERILIFADLSDDDLFTKVTANGQELWNLGDVFEIFCRDVSGDRYYEFHVSPNAFNLQLRWPSAEFFQDKGSYTLDDVRVSEPLFDYQVRETPTGWQVLAELSAATLFDNAAPLEGQTWALSFGRYDVSSDSEKQTLSSTSPHQRPLSYHNQQYWEAVR
ncbi:MAG: hypothetical protein ACK5NG_01850, partial [Chthoniobacterales bacterium]